MPDINWIAVIVAAFVPIGFGALWYQKAVSSIVAGENVGTRRHGVALYVISVLASVMTASFIALLMGGHPIEEQNLQHGILHGSMLTVFVILPAMLIHFMFEGDRSPRNMLYHILFWVITTGIMGAIIGAWH
jgi:hypothetical protein